MRLSTQIDGSRVNDPCGVEGQRPSVNSPRQQPVKVSSAYQSGAGASEKLVGSPAGLLLFSKKGAPAALPFLLCPVSGVMHSQLEHRDEKRITPVCPLCVLSKAVRLVQSVTIPAPIDVIFLCGILAFPFDSLDFLRNQPADLLLTLCQNFHLPSL